MGLLYAYQPAVSVLPAGPATRGMFYSLIGSSLQAGWPMPRATQFLTDWGVFWQGVDAAGAFMEVLIDGLPAPGMILGPMLGASGFLFATAAVPVAGPLKVSFRLSWPAPLPNAAFSTSVVVRDVLGEPTVARIMGNFPVIAGNALQVGTEDADWLDSVWNGYAPGLPGMAGGVLIPKAGCQTQNIRTRIAPGANTLSNASQISIRGSVSGFLASTAYAALEDGQKSSALAGPVLTAGEFLVVHGGVSPVGLVGALTGDINVSSKLDIP